MSSKASKILGVPKNQLPVYTLNPIHKAAAAAAALEAKKGATKTRKRRGGGGEPRPILASKSTNPIPSKARYTNKNINNAIKQWENGLKTGKQYRNFPGWAYNARKSREIQQNSTRKQNNRNKMRPNWIPNTLPNFLSSGF